MTAGIPRYMIEPGQIEGSVTKSVELAFAAIYKLCNEQGIDQVTLVMPNKKEFQQSIVAEFLGAAASKSLAKGKSVVLGKNGPSVKLESPETFSRHTSHGVVIGGHISGGEQRRLESTLDAKAIFYLPWTRDEAVEYLTTWRPVVIGPVKLAPADDTLPLEVETALDRLTNRVNLSTGLGHPLDKAAAKQMVQTLKADGYSLDPDAIGRWALRHGWDSAAAAKLESLVRK
jgi:hypothetical protein